jgi:hypothetical protein
LRISPADNNDAVDVIAYRLRHLHYLRQVVLRATLTFKQNKTTFETAELGLGVGETEFNNQQRPCVFSFAVRGAAF